MAQLPRIDEYRAQQSAQAQHVMPHAEPTQIIGPQAIGNVLQQINEQDAATQTAKALSKAQFDWQQNLQDRMQSAEPGAPNFTPNVLKDYDDYTKAAVAKATPGLGRKFLSERLQAFRGHVADQALSFEAGERVKNNIDTVKQSVDMASNEVMNNPDVFGERIAERNTLIDAMRLDPNTKRDLKTAAQQTLAVASVRGMINADPAAAKEELSSNDPKSLAVRALDAKTREQMLTHADTAVLAREVEARRQEALRLKQEKEREKVTQDGLLQKFVKDGLSTQDILNADLPAFGEGSKKQFLDMLDASVRKDAKSDPATFNSLFSRIHLPDGDPHKIVNENALNQYLGKGLSIESLQKLREEITGNQTEAGKAEAELKKGLLDVAKSTLTRSNPLIGLRDPTGDEQLQRYTSWFLDEYKRQREAGKSSQQLLNPGSPDYLGSRIRTYARSPQQIMDDMTQGMLTASPGAPQRKEGESAADYLKRTGK